MTDSDYEDEAPKHSFVNHYMSDPTYYNSWKRQPKGLKTASSTLVGGVGTPPPFGYEERRGSHDGVGSNGGSGGDGYYQTVVTQHSAGGVYTPTGQPAAPGTRTPVTGFSSFV